MEPAPIHTSGDSSFMDKLKLSKHPITLVTYLIFRSAGWVVYFLGMWFTKSMIMVFIITILLLAADFYYLKNIAGRRLVGLRWWNEVDPSTGEAKWVFESRDYESAENATTPTDSYFFWLALYVQPVVWIVMAILALVRLQFTWLPLVAIALALAIMNTLAFSRCDKFSQASNMAGSTLRSTSLASRLTGHMVGRWLNV